MNVFIPANTKNFMKSLLLSSDFDSFVLVEACIYAAVHTSFDGSLDKDFYTDSDEKFIRFSVIKPLIVSLIKGDKPPKLLKIVLAISQSDLKTFIKEREKEFISVYPTGLFLNIRFEGGSLSVTSGTVASDLDREKIVDKTWDSYLSRFLIGKELI